MSEINVASLHMYPIKGCRGIDLTTSEITENGLALDRNFVIVTDQGEFLSQRSHPELATVVTSMSDGVLGIDTSRGSVVLDLSNMGEGEKLPVDIFEKIGTATSAGAEAAELLSDTIGESVRLLRIADARSINPNSRREGAVNQTAFADGYPILLTSQGTLDAMNELVGSTVSMDRFRSNIVITGAEGGAEDYWREIRVGRMRAFVVRACARCPVPNVDQVSGKKDSPAQSVSKVLGATRRGTDVLNEKKGVFFGQNLNHIHEPGLTISVGDSVEVHVRDIERNII